MTTEVDTFRKNPTQTTDSNPEGGGDSSNSNSDSDSIGSNSGDDAAGDAKTELKKYPLK